MTGEFTIAVHALVFLDHKQETLSSEELAANICTNPVRVRKVMARLKKYNLLDTKEGLRGGYRIARNPEDINLKQICDALQMDIVKTSWHSGNIDMPCLVASGMAGVMGGIYGNLNKIGKQYLESITIKDIEEQIFGNAD